jgi:hypothetical protein
MYHVSEYEQKISLYRVLFVREQVIDELNGGSSGRRFKGYAIHGRAGANFPLASLPDLWNLHESHFLDRRRLVGWLVDQKAVLLCDSLQKLPLVRAENEEVN